MKIRNILLVQVEFSADTLRLNLIDLARTGSKLITVTGRLEYACTATDSADPVSFTTRDAHLVRHCFRFFDIERNLEKRQLLTFHAISLRIHQFKNS